MIPNFHRPSFHFFCRRSFTSARVILKDLIIDKLIIELTFIIFLNSLQSGSMEFAVELTKKFPTMLYLCWDANSVLRFQFFVVPTVADFCVTDWVLVSEFRKNSSSEQFIDDIFLKKMRLVSDTPEGNQGDVWLIETNV